MSGLVLLAAEPNEAPAATPKRLCAVCEDTSAKPGDDVYICTDCANPTGVTVYCMRCKSCLHLVLVVAHAIYADAEVRIPHAGVVIRHDGCPLCIGDQAKPDIFTLNVPRAVESDDDRLS